MNAPRITMLLALALGLFANACATSQPSPMLVEAREDYDDARTGMAGKYAPDLVYEAKKSLDAAERAHSRDPGSAEEEHLAYLAQRRTMLAVSAAEQQKAHQDSTKAEKAFETVLVSQRDEAQNKYAKVGDQLADERERRRAAEEQARRAMASLNEIASVKAEETRTVITLSGEVLFKTNEATLLPIAQTQLDKVAEALKSQGEDKKIVIEGHTDSRGKDDFNQSLSQRRAEAVRSYLVSRGLDAEMVQALGKGELEPVADNKTAEGRANNRRVEIEIPNSSEAAPMKSK